ncbi:hypothetical protein F4820DRAFT_47954 [Hypoxylon rubiginosum]|uniref:Uncharacterized protein n=1 Tax=Hypoxylon rubiginosum TaxID=110542 RepID=A0ACB9YR21_9PEZI|nr:hypothetical protein F4820DRAFT_47954 [Hypoxylon rubiginosum]
MFFIPFFFFWLFEMSVGKLPFICDLGHFPKEPHDRTTNAGHWQSHSSIQARLSLHFWLSGPGPRVVFTLGPQHLSVSISVQTIDTPYQHSHISISQVWLDIDLACGARVVLTVLIEAVRLARSPFLPSHCPENSS